MDIKERRKQAILLLRETMADSYMFEEELRHDARAIIDMAIQIGRDEMTAEAERWRLRCPVAEDEIVAAGVTLDHVRAWLVAHGWHSETRDVFGWCTWTAPDGEEVDLWRMDLDEPMWLNAIDFIADHLGRPTRAVLDEVVSMEADR